MSGAFSAAFFSDADGPLGVGSEEVESRRTYGDLLKTGTDRIVRGPQQRIVIIAWMIVDKPSKLLRLHQCNLE